MGKSVTFGDVINQNWQEKVINKYISRLHLDKTILCKSNFINFVNNNYKGRGDSKKLIKKIANEIEKKRSPLNIDIFANLPMDKKYSKCHYLTQKIYRLGVHIVKSDNIDLIPVKKV